MNLRPLALALLVACHAGPLAAQTPPPASGIARTAIDPAVRPQDDLYRHANGAWIRNTTIPPDRTETGVTRELRDRAEERVRVIVEQLAENRPAPGSVEQKVGDYYRGYLDEAAIDAAGLKPVEPWLQAIDALADKAALAALWGRLEGIAETPIAMWVDADPKNPGLNMAHTWQSGLGLPDRDYYLKADPRFAQARAAYLEYLTTVLQLSGDPAPAKSARTVLALEQRIARAHWSNVQNRDSVKRYNPMSTAELRRRAPGFDWVAYFEAAALPRLERLSVSQPGYAVALAGLVRDVPLATWKLYQRTRLLDSHGQLLPQGFRDAHFALHGKAVRGQLAPRPRWQLAIHSLDGALGEAVGQVYVARHFPPAHKARMQQLVANLLAAYGQSIDTLGWMGPQTRQRARQKLAKYTVKIGYPDVWRDYAKLEVRPGDALGNAVRAGRFEHERLAVRVGQPVDRSEWGMTPQTVNAYYNPTLNEIVFPAAILQPPYFDMAADDAANYGSIGATIGHEISHGFDDDGSRYDGNGKLDNWWTAADRKAFDALGAKLAAQADTFEWVRGHKVNGKLTLGENIADLAGLQIAHRAWKLSLGGKPAPVIDGLAGEQRFFLAYAQSWREKMRDERALQLLVSDPHAPSEFRTNGIVVHSDAFHEAFATQPGDRLWKPADARLRFW